MADALARMRSADSQQGMAESLMSPEYVPNSGLLGSIAMMAQAAAGKKMAGRASKEDAAAREAYYKGQAGQEGEKARREAEKQQAEFQAKIDDYNKNDPAIDAVRGFKRDKPEQPQYDIREVNGKLFYVPKSPVMAQQQNSPAANAGFQALRDAVMWQESRGNPNAVSPKGAMGTMQTMPNTLRDPGYGVAPARDNSPQEMERVGTDYLKAMTGKYGLEGGLAAYNWGPGNWEKALQAAGGDPQRALQMAPRETQQYVPSVLGRVGSGGGAGVGFGLGQGAGVPAGAIPVDGLPSAQPQTVQTLSPDEIKAIGLPAGTVAQRKPDGTISVVNKPETPAGPPKLSPGEASKVRGEMKDIKDALGMFKAFDSAVTDIGKLGSVLDGKQRGQLGTAYNNARSALRVLYNTGVLQPGELPMLNQALQDPNSFSSFVDPRSRDQIQAQLDELYGTVERQITNKVRSYPQLYNNQVYDAVRSGQQQPEQPEAPSASGNRVRIKL